MKAIFKGNNFAIVWNIIDSSTHTPFDFSGMKVEVGLYSECCKKAIQTYNISNGTIEFEVESEELQNGVYNLMCRYSTENEQAYCIYKRAFQITGKPEFASNVETIILESKASHIDATDHDDPIPDFENCQLIAQELFKENFRLPQLTADRAIADEHGNRIADTYVSREAVTKHIRNTYNQQFLENPPLITEGYITPQMLSDETRQLLEESGATINNLPDGEDLQSVHGVLKLANKQHNPNSYSGLGRQYLRKNIVAGQNVLTQSMLQWPNTIYIIQYDYDLNGETITIPAGCTLDFQGGCLSNGTIVGNNTAIQASLVKIFGLDIEISGNWNVPEVYPEWFGVKGDGINDDTKPLQHSFKFSKNKIIHLSKNKIYNIRKSIQVYSNTEIIFDGTILCTGNACLEFFDRNIEQPGYTGVHDVYIHGCGSFDCNGHNIENTASAFRIHHCRNITIKDITIKNWFRYHAIEIGGSKNVIIRNITINNAYGQINDENATAIQVERCSEGGTVGAIPYDYTITKDVSIIGCTFTCTDSQYGYTAIESHDKIFDSEQKDENSFSNIIIKDCTFKDIPILPGLQPLISFDSNFKDVRIESNIFDNVYDNILYIGRYCNNININNNIFRNIYKGIVQIGSGVETNSKYIVISNNKILNCSKDLSPSIYIARKADFLIIEHNYIELYNEESSKPFHMPSTGNTESIIFKDNFISNATILTEEALKDLHEQLSRFEYKSENSAMGRNYTNYFTDIPKMTSKGSTANRPKSWSKGGFLSNNDDIGIGFMYFDTDLGKPVYVKSITSGGVIWVDATGAEV